MTRSRTSIPDDFAGPPPLDDDTPAAPTPSKKPKRPTGGRPPRTPFDEINGFIDVTLCDLSRAEICVWLILWRDAKRDGTARTGQADIARRAGVDVSTVKRAIGGLRRRGLLKIVFRGSLAKGPSRYAVRPFTPVKPPKTPTLPPER